MVAGGVVQAFNPRTQETDRGEFEATLVFRVNSRSARATQRSPVFEKRKQKQKIKEKNKRRHSIYLSIRLVSIHNNN